MSGALAGIRVIEIGQEIQGPYAGVYLADMGADVVKVENRKFGDVSRWLRADLFFPDAKPGHVSPFFLAMNRGKRSVTVGLKSERGKEVLWRLLETADVLLCNHRPGVLDRLGFAYEEVSRRHPRLVYALGSSWGLEGPWRTRPSRDPLAQAAGGLTGKTGVEGGPPLPAGAAIADTNAGLALASSILAALFVRERTGKGQQVGASIYGTVIAMQAFEIAYAAYGGRELPRAGRSHPMLRGVWGTFPTKDGWLSLAGVDDKRWPRFCAALGIEHLRDDPECGGRGRNYEGKKIAAALEEVFPQRTTAEWLELLGAADVLATEVAGHLDVLASEQARVNRYVTEIPHPEAGSVTLAGNPITMSDTPLDSGRAAPGHGEHTEEILLELGYGWGDIAALREAGAI